LDNFFLRRKKKEERRKKKEERRKKEEGRGTRKEGQGTRKGVDKKLMDPNLIN
jgi:hypothetical protein